MKCAQCGSELNPDVFFCTNCGAPVQASNDPVDVESIQPVVDEVVEEGETVLGAALESAVQANQAVIDEFEAHGQIVDEASARWAEAAPVTENNAQYAPAPASGAPEAPQGYVPPSYGNTSDQVQGAAAAAAAGVAGAASVPFYQQDVSPNAHYSSQRTYETNAYGQNTGQPPYGQGAGQQPGYQQPSYGQGGPAPQREFPQPATKRAYAMTLYAAGLLGLIFGLCVRDKDDAFITHHLNNCAVITVGMIISSFLAFIFIGGILALYLIVMFIMGIVSAYNGDTNELPLIGKIHIVK